MRDITKSMLSYTWAMSVFGMQQAANVFRRGRQRDNRATEAFEDVTGAVAEQFDDTLKSAFRAGDNLQRGLVDLMFGGMGVMNADQWRRAADRTAGAARDVAGRAAGSCWTDGRGAADDRMPRGASFGRGPAESSGSGRDTSVTEATRSAAAEAARAWGTDRTD